MPTTIQVTAVSVKRTGTGKNGKPYTIREVTVSNGNKYDSFDEFEIGKEYQVDIKPNSDSRYSDSISKVRGNDPVKEAQRVEQTQHANERAEIKDQRITILSCISSASNFYQHRQGTEQQVIAFARQLFAVAMNHKQDDLPF